jgi:hypothetical protein
MHWLYVSLRNDLLANGIFTMKTRKNLGLVELSSIFLT